MQGWRAVVVSLLNGVVLCAQPAALLKLTKNDAAPAKMTSKELKALRDPFFQLVLKKAPMPMTLAEVERRLQPEGQSQLFIVSEEIADPVPGRRRAVLTFQGTKAGILLKPNLMVSVAFEASRFPADEEMEVLAWDDNSGRYHFYKLQRSANEPKATWKFRGSSDGADQLTPDARRESCFACHVNGAPIMKEFSIPWNNWHSPRFAVSHLTRGSSDAWAVVQKDNRFLKLGAAETLETGFVGPSIRQFNQRRLAAQIRRISAAVNEAGDAKRLLRPLFVTTEVNIVGALEPSGIHPLGSPISAGEAIRIPDSFFLNANLIIGNAVDGVQGLQMPEARFSDLPPVTVSEYQKLVQDARLKIGGMDGDSFFGWFVPEPAHVDVHLIDLLIRRGVVSRQFVAAVLAVDVETPIFSARRVGLLDFVPKSFRFRPATASSPGAHPDELTRSIIKRLEAGDPAANSAAKELLENLRSPDPIEVLRVKIAAYHVRVRAKLTSVDDRETELKRLFSVLVDRRRQMLENPVLRELRESAFLFGLPVP